MLHVTGQMSQRVEMKRVETKRGAQFNFRVWARGVRAKFRELLSFNFSRGKHARQLGGSRVDERKKEGGGWRGAYVKVRLRLTSSSGLRDPIF